MQSVKIVHFCFWAKNFIWRGGEGQFSQRKSNFVHNFCPGRYYMLWLEHRCSCCLARPPNTRRCLIWRTTRSAKYRGQGAWSISIPWVTKRPVSLVHGLSSPWMVILLPWKVQSTTTPSLPSKDQRSIRGIPEYSMISMPGWLRKDDASPIQ